MGAGMEVVVGKYARLSKDIGGGRHGGGGW